jgi:hypothetical protein
MKTFFCAVKTGQLKLMLSTLERNLWLTLTQKTKGRATSWLFFR